MEEETLSSTLFQFSFVFLSSGKRRGGRKRRMRASWAHDEM
jgi:hypothetical protein